MIKGSKAQRILLDKAYTSKSNPAAVKGKHRDGILHKGLRGRSLRQSQKRFNKRISKPHFRVEGCFGTMRRLFGLNRARYFDIAKTHAQMVMAANKITLNKQTPAIA
ncbi:transposase [Rhodobacteraceae bacterium]|nr:transposase [Paracoccaceae bacterium]